jgi:hypothetical protein
LAGRATIAILLGVALTLVVRGYRFGESNHAVYLVDAIRRTDPSLLERDWWVQSTLQYHFVFNAMTAGLMRAGLLEPAFLLGYLALAVLLHVAWRRITLILGGNDAVYLLSVVFFYLLAGGLGLGMYHFLQDSAFLPSNIANVAMLWAIYFWIAGSPASAGVCFGVAGLFHINHALAGIVLWAGASIFEGRRGFTRAWWLGTVALFALSAMQIVPAARVVLARSGKLPLDEFVDLFVRLRHPHHFDPRAWHWGVWFAFLVPLPIAYIVVRRMRAVGAARTPELRRASVLFTLFCAMLVLALLGAGFWYASETLVQLNLYRFSIYPKLLSCVAAGWLTWELLNSSRLRVVWVVVGLCFMGAAAAVEVSRPINPYGHNTGVAALAALIVVVAIGHVTDVHLGRAPSWHRLFVPLLVALALTAVTGAVPAGIRIQGLAGDEPGYVELARWARDNTPKDALFLVPPDEESFRVHARRAIVVNFKGVPQLSAELPEWRDRLCRVLGTDTRGLLALPRPMGRTLEEIRARYDALPPEHHFGAARHFGARYVVLTQRTNVSAGERLVRSDSNGRYFLYDLQPEPAT